MMILPSYFFPTVILQRLWSEPEIQMMKTIPLVLLGVLVQGHHVILLFIPIIYA